VSSAKQRNQANSHINDGTRLYRDLARETVPDAQDHAVISTPFDDVPSRTTQAGSEDTTPSPSPDQPTELTAKSDAPTKSAKPHYFGHRQRLRARFLKGGGDALAEYELLELLLCMAMPRGDVKPLAKSLLAQFGNFAAVISAPPATLGKVKGLGEAGIAALKIAEASAQHLSRERAMELPVIASWEQLIDYCRVRLGHRKTEELHLLFLDRKNRLIADECHQTGTVDHTPVYPREVVKRALELDASAIIVVHNHPSGDATPSQGDINMTRKIVDAAKAMDILVHDHIIISQAGYNSFKTLGLI
jgi:DNA repair protein RadC